MMNKNFIYNGYIKTSSDDLINALKNCLDSNKLRERYAADVQKEIRYKDENIELYIFDDLNNGFILQTELKGTINEAKNFITLIVDGFKNYNISDYQFEWGEIDEDYNIIGEEFVLKSLENN